MELKNIVKKPVIGIIGAAEIDTKTAFVAEELGFRIAERGGIIICGGLSGVMEAACRGAKKKGGLTIGVLPGDSREDANPFIDIPIVTGLSHARNIIIVRSSHLCIAVSGSYGTLSEISFALKLGRPVITLGSWELDAPIIKVNNPGEAVDEAYKILENQGILND